MRRSMVWMALFLAACGGSGGGAAPEFFPAPDAEPFVLAGAYGDASILVVERLGGGPVVGASAFGSALLELDGADAGRGAFNLDGVLSGPVDVDRKYAVHPDGTLERNATIGAMSADARVAALLAREGGVNLLVRREGAFDVGSLEGTYRYAYMAVTTGSPTVISAVGTAAFDGAGTVLWSPEVSNVNGVLTVGSATPGTYTVSPSGAVTIDIVALQLEGDIGLDGELVAVAGGVAGGQAPFLGVFLKQIAEADHAHLQGEYTLVIHEFDPVLEQSVGYYGTCLADGAGSVSLRLPIPDARLGPVFSRAGDYAIAPDGRLDLVALGNDFRGAITSNGDVAFLGGGVLDGDRPALGFLIRKRAVPATNAIRLDAWQSGSLADGGGGGLLPVPRGPVLEPVSDAGRLTIGEGGTVGRRALVRFDLTTVPPGRTLARAVLVTSQDEVRGDPYVTLGPLQVDHVVAGAVLDGDDLDPPRRRNGRGFGVLSTGPSLGQRAIDVTAAVRADLEDDRRTSDFLLFFATAEDGDGDLDQILLDDHSGRGPSTGPRTRLVVTFE